MSRCRGRIALRKTLKLLEAGFRVELISPEVVEGLSALVNLGRINWCRKEFESEDLSKDFFLIISATNDNALNRRIIELSSELRILCSAVDENWRDSDFIMPASFVDGSVQVAVSTGGLNCRKSKMLKDSVAKHLKMLDKAELFLIGTDFKLLSLEKREKIQMLGESAEALCSMLAHIWGLHEFTLIQTCNRIELISVACPITKGLLGTLKRILKFDELGADSCYQKTGWEAFKHFALLLAGLKSQSVGEKNIVSQVKKSVSQSVAKGWAASMTRELCDSALHISKHIRNAEGKEIKAKELNELCIEFLKKKFETLKGLNAVILGSGQTGMDIVWQLDNAGCQVTCFYRSRKPKNFPASSRLLKLPIRGSIIRSADIILCAMKSPERVLDERHSSFFDSKKELIIFDLGVPRNVSPKLSFLVKNISLYNLESLQKRYEPATPSLDKELQKAETIIELHRFMFEKLMRGFQVASKKN